MADALSGLTEVDVNIETVVSTQVQEVLTAEMVVPPTIMDMSAMVRPGMDTLDIPRFSNFTVGSKSENTPVDAQTNTFSKDSLQLNNHKVVQWLLESIADLQSKVAVNNEYITQAAKDLAAEMDNAIITAMVAGVSSSAPDHIIDFQNTPTDTLSKLDFLEARRLLNVAKVSQSERYCLVHPTREKDILNISEFTRIDEAGLDASQALRNGQIGKLFGFSVLLSPQAVSDGTLFYHRTDCAFARQLAPRVQTESALEHLGTRYSIDHIYGVKVLDSGKRSVKVKDGGA